MNDKATTSVRAKEEKAARRRRIDDDPLNGVQFHLGVPPHLKRDGYVQYWANDDKGRVEYLTTQDDWDFVEDRNANGDSRNKGGGTRLERTVGRGRDGNPIRAVLLEKRKDYYDEDNARQLAKLDARNRRLRETQDDDSGHGILSGDPRHGYVPREIDTSMPRIKRV